MTERAAGGRAILTAVLAGVYLVAFWGFLPARPQATSAPVEARERAAENAAPAAARVRPVVHRAAPARKIVRLRTRSS